VPSDPTRIEIITGRERRRRYSAEQPARGYATELTTACTSLADNVLQLPEVCAFARPENIGSRRVLEKAGFELVRFVPEMARFLYRRGRQGERLAA